MILSAPEAVEKSLADRLIEIVRREMKDENLNVEVHCLKNYWHKTDIAEEDSEADAD